MSYEGALEDWRDKMYPGGAQAEKSASSLRTRDVEVSYREQLEQEASRLEAMAARKREMIKLLDENPAIERFMDLSRG